MAAMLIERFEVPGLAHYSYAIGCTKAGAIMVVDPERNIEGYLKFAADQKVQITHILETHIHADFASGARALSEATGAQLLLSAYDRNEQFEVGFDHTPIEDGFELTIGPVRLVAMHTPGHTPEHMSYLLYDQDRSEQVPMIMLSGDFLFVGSLGRPDLLGEEATKGLAKALYHSVQRASKELPDGLEINPGHGAGSSCGAGLGGRPVSTLGFERIANPYLDPNLTEEIFVEKLLAALPPAPPYYPRMKALNAAGPAILKELPGTATLSVHQVSDLADQGATILDIRDQRAFAHGHIPGALSVGQGGGFVTWAPWVIPYEKPIVLVTDGHVNTTPLLQNLVRIGLDDVRGSLDGGMSAWQAANRPIECNQIIDAQALQDQIESAKAPHVLDVRTDAEYEQGHIQDAQSISLQTLAQRIDEIPSTEKPLVVACGGGYRSTIAISLLMQCGHSQISDLAGGMNAWKKADLPVQAGPPKMPTGMPAG